jgi:hypothetical protein
MAMLNIPTFNKYSRKDALKFKNCNKLIAYAKEGSTAIYAQANPDCTNVGNYTTDDIVGISVNGDARNNWHANLQLATAEMKLAIAAGATIVADNEYDRNRKYNYMTEGYLVIVLTKYGCIEKPIGSGVWDCSNAIPESIS